MNNIHQNIAIVVLAAGASSRMGDTKQLLPWRDTTLLGQALKTAKDSAADSVTLVLGANAEEIRKGIPEKQIDITVNSRWQSGLGSSIACGMKFLLEKNKALKGILIMLADQPLIDTAYLNTMIAEFGKVGKQIIATSYKRRAGVPAIFGPPYFQSLKQLEDDFGAKHIIDSNPDQVLVLEPGDKTVDIDTKSEYKNLITKYS